MKAIVYYAPGDIRVEERDQPTPTDDNIIAKVICCAICGSDLKMWLVGNARCNPPRIIGHEMSGVLVHVGKNVDGYAVGERVTLATTVGCGECYYCKNNLSNICPDSLPISNASDGAFAEYIQIPPLAIKGGNVIKVPTNVSDEDAALSEPLSCAVNAQQLAGVKAGDKVVLLGGGPLGALHAQLARALGAVDVIVSEISDVRVDMLNNVNGIYAVNSTKVDLGEIVKQRTGGIGADVVIVCAPVKDAHEKSLEYVRKGGSICFFASIPKENSDITMDSRVIHYGEIKICGVSDSRPEHVSRSVELMAQGKIDGQAVITHRLPLEDFHKGLELMKTGQSLKILIYPEGVVK